jgi:iron complex outermembrane recepter protein
MGIFRKRALTFLIGLCMILTTGLSVQAQIEEIVVTAQKRAESVQEVPIAISAFSGDNLRDMGVGSAEEIMGLMANAGTISQGGSKMNYFLRGVGTQDFHSNVVGAVGVYLDDVALNSPYQLAFATFDTERVEVLKGPQNTLFGRNTTAGAVNHVSRKPSVDEGTNGYADVTYGRFDQIDAEGAVGIALNDNVAIRAALSSKKRDGAYDNLTTGEDWGEIDKQAGRLQLLFKASDSLEFLFNIHGGVSRGDPTPWKNVGSHDPANRFADCAVPLAQQNPQNNPNCVDSTGFNHQTGEWNEVHSGSRHRENLDLWGSGLKVTWDVGAFTVTSVSAYDSVEVQYSEDSDGTPNVGFQFSQEGEYDQWAQEIRIQSNEAERLRGIAGGYYFFEEAVYGTTVRRTPAPFAPSAPGSFNVIPNTQVDQDNEVFSGYGQVEFDIQDNLTATVGFRITRETKTGYNRASVRCAGVGGPPFCTPLHDNAFLGFNAVDSPALVILPVERLSNKDTEWGSRFALDWQVNDDLLAYASISRGFKAGGFSLAALQALTVGGGQAVVPETLWAYELGFKSNWMDNSLQVNGAVFYYDWKNMQSFQPLFNPATGFADPQLLNVPEASMLGADLDIQWIPAEGWLVMAGLGFLDGQIDDPGLIAGVLKGNALPSAPDLTFTGMVRKEFQIGDGTAALQTNWRYQDFVTYDLANNRNLSQPSYWVLNARGSYTFGSKGQYDVSVWGKNLTGENYCTARTDLNGLVDSTLCIGNIGEPIYGISAAYSFD